MVAVTIRVALMASGQQSENLILATLPSADLDLLRPNLRTVNLPIGLTVVNAGEIPKRVYFPHSGIIASCITLSNGHVVETRITGREGALGAVIGVGERPSFTSAVVRVVGQASVIDDRGFQAAIDRSAALRALLARHEAFQQAMADQSVACNATHSVEARLARRLLRLRNMSGQAQFTVTQEVLAEMLGIRRNAVSLVAHEMQRANLIRYSRGRLEIVDFAGLDRLACECYRTVTAYKDLLESNEVGAFR